MLHLVAEFYRTPWALPVDVYETVEAVLMRWSTGVRLDATQVAAAVGNGPAAAAARRSEAEQRSTAGAVAVIPVYGVLTHRAVDAENVSSPMTSTERLAQQIRAAIADPEVGAVVLDVNSPGGSVFGVSELGDTIYGLRGDKRIVAVASPSAASGAYWLASQADEFVVTPSGMVGSIGVIMQHINAAEFYKQKGLEKTYITSGKHKAEGNDTGPLTPETRDYMQAMSDMYYSEFVKAVARGRGKPVGEVRGESFGQGRMRTAREALAAGMVDRIDTLDSVIAGMAKPRNQKPRGLSASTAAAQIAVIEQQGHQIAV